MTITADIAPRTAAAIDKQIQDTRRRVAVIVSWEHGLERALVLAFTSHMGDSETQQQVNELLAPLPDMQRESLRIAMTAAADGNDDSTLYDVAREASRALAAALRDAFGGAR